jgi:glycosyltransferase involved in cell wall biosynthesis
VDFSIIVPTYNCELYLKQCLDSIVTQKHMGKTQIIIVDNESTDKTLEIARQYKDVVIISEKDKGEPDALNKGFKLAKGQIVAWLDADDFYEPTTLYTVESEFKNNYRLDWVYGKSYFVNENGKRVRRMITTAKQWLQASYSYDKLCALCFIAQPSVFMRKEFQQKIGDFNVNRRLNFDYEYWLRAGKISDPLFISEYLSSMRAHDGSLSVKYDFTQMKQSLDMVKLYKKNYKGIYLLRVFILSLTLIYYRTIGKVL